MTVTVDQRPTLISVAGSVIAVLAIGLLFATVDFAAAVPAMVALPFIVFAGVWGNRRAMTFGILGILLALVLAGLSGAGISTMLAAGVLAITAWDLLDHGFSLGEQVGRTSRTIRSELAHGGATLLVGTGVAALLLVGIAYIPGGWPVAGVVFALLAGMFALLALEERRSA